METHTDPINTTPLAISGYFSSIKSGDFNSGGFYCVDQNGVKNLKFVVGGSEKISINDNQVETIRVICDELQLTLNLSKKDSFQPVKIHKINGKTEFTMMLIEFKTKS